MMVLVYLVRFNKLQYQQTTLAYKVAEGARFVPHRPYLLLHLTQLIKLSTWF